MPAVSRALSDAPDIGSDTKDRVKRIAAEIGYVRNRAGLGLRTGKTHVISFVMQTDVGMMDHTGQIISSVARALTDTAYNLSVAPHIGPHDRLEPVRHLIETRSADAVILNRIETEDARVRLLMDEGFPFVAFGRTRWQNEHAYFDFDNGLFARNAMKFFHQRACRSIALIPPPREQAYGRAIIAGAQAEAIARNMEFSVIDGVTLDDENALVQKAVAQYLRDHPNTDGLICPDTGSAVAAVVGAEAVGREIGTSLAIFARETQHPFLHQFRHGIECIRDDVSLAGRILAEAAIQAIEKPDLPPIHRLVAPCPISE